MSIKIKHLQSALGKNLPAEHLKNNKLSPDLVEKMTKADDSALKKLGAGLKYKSAKERKVFSSDFEKLAGFFKKQPGFRYVSKYDFKKKLEKETHSVRRAEQAEKVKARLEQAKQKSAKRSFFQNFQTPSPGGPKATPKASFWQTAKEQFLGVKKPPISPATEKPMISIRDIGPKSPSKITGLY